GPRPTPAAAWSSAPLCRPQAPAPVDTARPHGSRIAWCGRRPPGRRYRRRCNTVSARVDGSCPACGWRRARADARARRCPRRSDAAPRALSDCNASHVLSEFGTGDRKRQLLAPIGRAAEAHALKWPLEGPAGLGKAIEKDLMGRDRIDQERTGLACDDLLQ